MGNFISASPNEAVLISGLGGTRVKVGQIGWKWWIVETKDTISLQVIQFELQSIGADTIKGNCIDVIAVATVKVKSTIKTETGKLVLDKEQILRAGTQFCGKTPDEIQNILKNCLEGHQRQVLGALTVDQVFKDRASFSMKVREHVAEDLEQMGFEVVSYTLKSMHDAQGHGYLASLGAAQIALVKRQAEEEASRNKQKVAQSENVAHIQTGLEKGPVEWNAPKLNFF